MEENKVLGMLKSPQLELNVLAASILLGKGIQYTEEFFKRYGDYVDPIKHSLLTNTDSVYDYRIIPNSVEGNDIVCVHYRNVGYILFAATVTLRRRVNDSLERLLKSHEKFIEI